MSATEDAIQVANGQVPRHDLAQVEVRDVCLHRGDGGLGRLSGPEAVLLLDAPRRSRDDAQVEAVLAQVVGVPRRVFRRGVVRAPHLPLVQIQRLGLSPVG